MAKSDYTHSIEQLGGKTVIVIEDLDLGNMSVTNNMEEVLSEIAIMEGVDPSQCLVVYKDSTGMFDGFNSSTGGFFCLSQDSWESAAEKYFILHSKDPVA